MPALYTGFLTLVLLALALLLLQVVVWGADYVLRLLGWEDTDG